MKKLDEILEFLFHTRRGIATLILGGISGTMLLGGCFVTDCISCACDSSCDGCWSELDDCVNNCVSCDGSCENTIFTGLFGAGCTSDCGDCGEFTLSCNPTDWDCGGSCSGCSDYDCSCIGFSCAGGTRKSSYTEPHVYVEVVYYNISEGSVLYYDSVNVYESDTSIRVYYSSYDLSTYFTSYGFYQGNSTSSTQFANASGSFIGGNTGADVPNRLYFLLEEKNYGETVTFTFEATVDGEDISKNSDFDGVNITGTATAAVGEDLTCIPAAPDVEGYTFTGWYFSSGTYVDISSISTLHLYSLGTTSTSIYLVAKYESNNYTVTIDIGGNTSSLEVKYGVTVGEIIDSISGTVEEYGRLLGVAYTSDAQSYLSESEKITDSCTLYIFYEEPIAITLHNADGPSSGSKTINGYYAGDTYTLSDGNITGYYFAGWYTDASCTQIVDSYNIYLDDDTSYTFYAKWSTTEQVRTEYYVNNNLINIVYYDYNATSGITLWTDIGSYLPTGYSLSGWCIGSSQTPVTQLPAGSEGTIKLYASFAAKTYTVYLDANGGTASQSTASITYGDDFYIPVPTRSGYVFAGWYYNNNQCTDEYGDSLDVFSEDLLGELPDSGITFTARWTSSASPTSASAPAGEELYVITKNKVDEE